MTNTLCIIDYSALLNNNPAYSEKFAIFGKKAAEAKKSGRRAGLGDGFFNDEGKLLIPRLIVDFTVGKEF